MPAYISHSIMANDVYKRISNENVSLDYMLTFSLGGDLARFSKCRRTCHKLKTEEFIDNMWNYIKDNNLINDKRYVGVLYGHICHYYMDIVCHPLIRKVDKESLSVGVKNHTLIEGYIDSYLVELNYNMDICKYNTKYIFNGSVIKVRKMIDEVYKKTYGVKCVSLSYFFTKILYSKIRWLFVLFGKSFLIKFSKFDNYLDTNKGLDILNIRNDFYYSNYNGNLCNDDFMNLYNDSVDLAVKRINNLK